MNEINWNEKIGILDDVDDMVEEFTKLFLDTFKYSSLIVFRRGGI
jgi:hypothetical protein